MRLAPHIFMAISLSFLERGSTRALPMNSDSELNFLGSSLVNPATGHPIVIGREIHNADYSNSGGPPQATNSSDTTQSSRANEPDSRAQKNTSSPRQNSNVARAATRISRNGKLGIDARKHRGHHTQSGERWHSANISQLANGDDGSLVKHTHDHQQAAANNSVTFSSHKVAHQDSFAGDGKATPPPSTNSSSDSYGKLVTRLNDSNYSSSHVHYLKARHEKQSNTAGLVRSPGDDDINAETGIA